VTGLDASPSRLDRWLAGGLTWLLLLVWIAVVVVAVLAAAGVSAAHEEVPVWSVAAAAVTVAATAVPVLRWLRPAVDAVLFSHPEDALDLITDVGHQVAEGAAAVHGTDAVTARIATHVAVRLRLPYVAILPRDAVTPPPTAAGPPPPERLVRIPLRVAGDAVGTLLVLPRPRERGLSAADHALLEGLAVHVAIAVHVASVSDDVRTSRAALVTAREEERRRIRRDLHDGLAPALASLRLQLAALQQLVPDRPQDALDLVARLRGDVRSASTQVRALVYGLHPTVLDELGLVEALRSRAAATPSVQVAVELPTPWRVLPAAVEIAIFRIAGEALANVSRHAGARTCTVTVEVRDDAVELRVDDDGRGLPLPLVPGVGIAGMRERAEELGGTLTVLPSRPGGPGTSVVAVLPVEAAAEPLVEVTG